MHRLFFAAALLAACNPVDVADTDTDPVVDTDTAPPTRVLAGGSYNARQLKKSNNTCGINLARNLASSPCDLIWTGDTTFDLTYNAESVTSPCTVAGGQVTCEGYSQGIDYAEITPTGPALVTYVSKTSAFNVTSTTSFENVESITATCEGDGCADFVAFFAIPELPCSIDLEAAYTQ